MPKITEIAYKAHKERYWIYIDGGYCTSIRARTLPAMGLKVGQEITCEKVKELENFHWKNAYGKTSWEKEKVRLDRVTALIKHINNLLNVKVTGFGADSDEMIKHHPDEQGKPDLEVYSENESEPIIFIEVTGTEVRRGTDYWVRPDKLKYCQNHPEQNVWIILHYAKPEEKFVFIKPAYDKEYKHEEVKIRDSIEYYVKFDDSSEEVKTFKFFKNHLLDLT